MSKTLSLRLRALAVMLGVCVSAGALALASPPAALAEFQHSYLSQLTGTPSGSFSESVCGVTVDPASQDVYVADPGSDAIDIFNSAGVYQSQITGLSIPSGPFSGRNACSVAVSDTTGDVYVADSGPDVVYVFNALGGYVTTMNGSGTPAEGGTPAGSFGGGFVHVAVDQSSGDVYVADTSDGVVDRFNSANEYKSQLTGLSNAFGLASDSSGDIYVAEGGSGGVFEFDSSGSQILEIAGTPSGSFENLTSVAVDSTGDVYVADRGRKVVDEFDSSGTFLDQVGGTPSGSFSDPEGVAVNAGGDLYVADRRESSVGVVDVFGPSVVVPDVATGAASSVTDTTATVAGTVNPDSTATTYQFEYGTSTTKGFVSEGELARRLALFDAGGGSRAGVAPPPSAAGGVRARNQAASPASVGSDSSTHTLTASLVGLAPNTVYHYRILAANANGTNPGVDGTFQTTGPPSFGAQSVTGLTHTGATINAEVNSGGHDTHVHVEYGTSAGYGSSTAPIDIGSEKTDQSVSVALTGLASGTTYHYHVVASSPDSPNPFDGPDQSFVTFTAFLPTSSALPDGRVYELVSPAVPGQDANIYVPEAGNGDLDGSGEHGIRSGLPFQVSSDGEKVVYPGDPPPTGGTGQSGDALGNEYLARRSPGGGWTQAVQGPVGNESAFSSDLSVGVLQRTPPGTDTGAPPEYGNLFSHATAGDEGGEYHPFFTVAPRYSPGDFFGTVGFRGSREGLGYAGANTGTSAVPASSHLLFEANNALTSNAAGGSGEDPSSHFPFADENNLYDSVGGQPYLVNVLPDGKTEADASFGSFPMEAEDHPADFSHVISADGSRIFWTQLEPFEATISDGEKAIEERSKALYVRENDTSSDAATVQADASTLPGTEKEKEEKGGGGRFWTASADGSRVFFTDCRQLTEGSTAVSSGGCEHYNEAEALVLTGNDLYEYEVNPEAGKPGVLRDLTVDERTAKETGDPLGADVQGVVGVSEDGSYVYFAAGGVLADNENGEKEKATPRDCEAGNAGTGCNLYVRHEGVTTFIATLSLADNSNVTPFDGVAGDGKSGDWRADVGFRTAQVTPDGRSLLFVSNRSLTGYNNGGPGVLSNGNEVPLDEVFLYEAGASELRCVSCNPTGEPPVTTKFNTYSQPLGGFFPVNQSATYQPQVISDNGGRVFFDSGEPLVPQDTNGWLDVYEWERPASPSEPTNSCTRSSPSFSERDGGCTYLLSGGTDPEDSYLLGVDASGENAFIVSRAQLLAQDRGDDDVVYDARVGGVRPPGNRRVRVPAVRVCRPRRRSSRRRRARRSTVSGTSLRPCPSRR